MANSSDFLLQILSTDERAERGIQTAEIDFTNMMIACRHTKYP